jgi:hypothetical protein
MRPAAGGDRALRPGWDGELIHQGFLVVLHTMSLLLDFVRWCGGLTREDKPGE